MPLSSNISLFKPLIISSPCSTTPPGISHPLRFDLINKTSSPLYTNPAPDIKKRVCDMLEFDGKHHFSTFENKDSKKNLLAICLLNNYT